MSAFVTSAMILSIPCANCQKNPSDPKKQKDLVISAALLNSVAACENFPVQSSIAKITKKDKNHFSECSNPDLVKNYSITFDPRMSSYVNYANQFFYSDLATGENIRSFPLESTTFGTKESFEDDSISHLVKSKLYNYTEFISVIHTKDISYLGKSENSLQEAYDFSIQNCKEDHSL